MPKAGEIRYCPELGGKATNAAFVWIPPGSFWMGHKHDTDNPVHFVTLTKGFWLQQTLLTERQYSNKNSDLPQIKISWDDVVDFCKGKTLRMPIDAEWEYAARSNAGHKYLWAGSNIADNVAWTKNNADDTSHKVGQLKSNSLGLFDMSGSVFEWCSDRYAGVSTIPQVNPTGPTSGSNRVDRGGGWISDPQYVWVVNRYSNSPGTRRDNLGVRLIWEPKDA